MKRGVLGLWGLVLLALAGVYYWRTQHAELATPRAGDEPVAAVTDDAAWPDTPVVDFELTDQTNKPFSSSELTGQVWVASFFFANCPGFCLNLNQQIDALVKELGDVDVRFVSFTVDAAHDTPAALADYSKRFNADPERWVFLTGDPAVIERVAGESFKVSAAPATHTGRVMLVDREGKVRGAYLYNSPSEITALKQKIKQLALPAKAPDPEKTTAQAEQGG